MLEEAVSVSVGETDRKRKDSSERVDSNLMHKWYIPQVPTREPLVECDT